MKGKSIESRSVAVNEKLAVATAKLFAVRNSFSATQENNSKLILAQSAQSYRTSFYVMSSNSLEMLAHLISMTWTQEKIDAIL